MTKKKRNTLLKTFLVFGLIVILSLPSFLYPAKTQADALATGGTYTEVGGYGIHTFTSSGTFTPSESMNVEVLVVGGGGAGHGSYNMGGGGGGGGGVLYKEIHPVTARGHAITVGAGGVDVYNYSPGGTAGGSSYFDGTLRGMGGGKSTQRPETSTRAGGSGGGMGPRDPTAAGGYSTQTSNNGGIGYGTAGGPYVVTSPYYSGGGGGAGQAGRYYWAGNGKAFSISGSSVYYGGGGGSESGLGHEAPGGLGGGGAGGGHDGTNGLGGGGGGAENTGGGRGGSGVVIVKYNIYPLQATGGSYTEIDGYGIHTFTSSDTFSVAMPMNVEILLVGGGGAGGGTHWGSGGGGAGGVLYKEGHEVSIGDYPIVVGAGGIGAFEANGTAGGDSTFNGTLKGWGGGTPTGTVDPATDRDGGSGGGMGHSGTSNSGGSSIQDNPYGGTAYGNAGGPNGPLIAPWEKGSGGGAGAAGTAGGAGGAGQAFSISGGSVTYAGGGGTTDNNLGSSAGGAGGGGAGGTTGNGVDGTDGLGGGGGASEDGIPGDGGSGVIIIRYPIVLPPSTPTIGTATVLSGTSIRWNFTDNSSNEVGFKVYDTDNNLKATCASANLFSCIETGLNSNTSYTRKVRAYNLRGNSNSSSTDTVSTLTSSCHPALGVSTHTVTEDCSFSGYTDASNGSRIVSGLESGTGTTNTSALTLQGGTLTINANETLVTGSLELTGGSIAVATGSKIITDANLWAIDADADGYPATTAFYAQINAPSNGVRINTLIDVTLTDCADGDGNVTLSCY